MMDMADEDKRAQKFGMIMGPDIMRVIITASRQQKKDERFHSMVMNGTIGSILSSWFVAVRQEKGQQQADEWLTSLFQIASAVAAKSGVKIDFAFRQPVTGG